MYESIVQARGAVRFPAYAGERHYMIPFTQRDGLPAHLAHWQGTVDDMLQGVRAPGEIYLMVDQSPVLAGRPQRRPGVHVDGYWCPGEIRHTGHTSKAGWRNERKEDWRSQRYPKHREAPRHAAGGDDWGATCDFTSPEAIMLASDVSAARAFSGRFLGHPGKGGDCSAVDLAGLQEIRLQAGRVYAGNVSMLHESLPVEADCYRTLVRLNVPGWTP